SVLIATVFPIRSEKQPDGYSWWVPGVVMFCMYAIGFVVAPLVALVLKRTLVRGETPVFVMELPSYKVPAWKTVLGRMRDSGWMFLRRAGTLILATMVVVWALSHFPWYDPDPAANGQSYEEQIDAAQSRVEDLKKEGADKAQVEEAQRDRNRVARKWI